jgi:hypothetical protein
VELGQISGIAHITDMHVARRIDRFRELLVQYMRKPKRLQHHMDL